MELTTNSEEVKLEKSIELGIQQESQKQETTTNKLTVVVTVHDNDEGENKNDGNNTTSNEKNDDDTEETKAPNLLLVPSIEEAAVIDGYGRQRIYSTLIWDDKPPNYYGDRNRINVNFDPTANRHEIRIKDFNYHNIKSSFLTKSVIFLILAIIILIVLILSLLVLINSLSNDEPSSPSLQNEQNKEKDEDKEKSIATLIITLILFVFAVLLCIYYFKNWLLYNTKDQILEQNKDHELKIVIENNKIMLNGMINNDKLVSNIILKDYVILCNKKSKDCAIHVPYIWNNDISLGCDCNDQDTLVFTIMGCIVKNNTNINIIEKQKSKRHFILQTSSKNVIPWPEHNYVIEEFMQGLLTYKERVWLCNYIINNAICWVGCEDFRQKKYKFIEDRRNQMLNHEKIILVENIH